MGSVIPGSAKNYQPGVAWIPIIRHISAESVWTMCHGENGRGGPSLEIVVENLLQNENILQMISLISNCMESGSASTKKYFEKQ